MTLSQNEVIIIGAGSHALVIADIILNLEGYKLIAFSEKNEVCDALDEKKKKVTNELKFPVISDREIFQNYFQSDKIKLILGIGQNLIALREKLIKKIKYNRYSFCSVIHPALTISTSSEIGEGTVVMAGAIINPFAIIGSHVVINTGAIIEHDCVIHDNTFIQPGARLAGNVCVGENSMVGIGATVLEGVCIGSNTIIGGGTLVNKDVPDNVVYVGVPAKKLRDNK